jgi:NADH-quinone oxidoreductase subunit M
MLDLTLVSIMAPALTSALLYLFKDRVDRYASWLATLVAGVSLLSIAATYPSVAEGQHVLSSYRWVPSLGLSFSLYLDVTSFLLSLVIALVSFAACLYSVKYMEGKPGQATYYSNLLLFMCGMIGVVYAANLIQFYVFWELMLVPSFFLITFWGESENRRVIGFKYFLFTHAGAVCILLAIATVYTYTGTFDLITLTQTAAMGSLPSSIVPLVFTLFLFGFMVKIAVFPVHTWLPDAHGEAPSPISAMLSGAMLKTGVYAIIRILLGSFSPVMVGASDILAVLAVLSMIYGGIMALAQTDIKRLLAYSSISQMGYIFFGLSTAVLYGSGLTGGVLHAMNHALCKGLLFLIAGVIIHRTHTRDINELGGLARKMPLISVAAIVAALSLAGTPPLAGFWSEGLLVKGAFYSGKALISLVASLATVITGGYYLRFIWKVFLGPPREDVEYSLGWESAVNTPLLFLLTLIIVLSLGHGYILGLIGGLH